MEIKIAIRNIFRSKRRSFINIICIVIGLLALLLIGGYYEYNYEGLREALIRSQYAHVQLTKKDFLSNQETKPFENLILEYKEMVKELKKDERVQVITPRLTAWGLLGGKESNNNVVRVMGVIPENESEINLMFNYKEGSELRSRDIDKIEIGKALADDTNIKLGESALVSVVDSEGYHNAFTYDVKGITGSFSTEYDKLMVKMTLAGLQDLVYVEGVQELIVLLYDTDDTKSYIKDLNNLIKNKGWDLEVTSWYDRAGYFREVVEYYGGFFKIILTIITIVIFFTTLNTMLMATLERVSEVGTIRSFGTPGNKVIKMFIFEGLVFSVISLTLAIVLAFLIKIIIDLSGGFVVPPPPGTTSSFTATILITKNNVIITSILAFVVPLFSTIIPSIKVAKMEIMEQLKFNDK